MNRVIGAEVKSWQTPAFPCPRWFTGGPHQWYDRKGRPSDVCHGCGVTRREAARIARLRLHPPKLRLIYSPPSSPKP